VFVTSRANVEYTLKIKGPKIKDIFELWGFTEGVDIRTREN
jgi:hypothetical protein